MSKFAGKAYHPINDSTEDIWEGFSWPCFFFGFFWYLYKGMWGWAVISFFVSIATFGIAWLFFPFFANAQYANSLLKRGYLNEKQQRLQASSVTNDSGPQQRESSSIADELQKLARLKEQGILSDEEFQAAKKRLIG